MFKNYFIIALRQVRKNKGFSLLNILGLSLGLACSILILLWVQDEVSYNKFHKKYDQLYQVFENHNYNGKIFTFAATPGLLAASMKEDIPEVKTAARSGWGDRWLFSINDKPVYENGNYVAPEFFDLFSFDFIYGNPENALADKYSLVITERMSKKFFGDVNPVGKYLKVNDEKNFLISGVVQTPPTNSTLQFDWLASFKIFEEQNSWWNNWGTNGLQTFVELKPLTSLLDFNKKFKSYIKSKDADASGEPLLLPMKDWRLRSRFEEGKQSGGRIEYVRLFSVIAILLIFIACINFMNLATARSEKRMKEVGVRKVMGAQRGSLMLQFMGESVTMAFLSMVIACILVLIFLPSFNTLVQKKLSIGLEHPMQWLVFGGIALLCGIVAGSYPSVFLSSFKPVSIFRGKQSGGGLSLVRKGLVVTQFVISIILIVSTVVIYKQISHVKNRQLGFNKDNLLYVTQNGTINKNLEVIEQDLIASGVVAHAASCNQRVMNMGTNTGGFRWQGKDPSKDVLITTEYVSPDYLNTAGMQLAAGRDFRKDGSDSTNIIINEALANIIGAKDPLNTIIRQDTFAYTVVGVVKDFVYNDMYRKPEPAIIFYSPHATSYVFVRINDKADTEVAIKTISSVFKKHNPGYPFEYNFLDQDFDSRFKSEMLVGKLSRLFAALTILISCLGLFGLAAYTAERRTKEIGIRKVLGASVKNVVALLSADFVKLVLIAILIASPIAWYIMNKWLESYAYRIDIQWWMFVVACSLAIVIAVFTVSLQTIKAAVSNPVKSLRTE